MRLPLLRLRLRVLLLSLLCASPSAIFTRIRLHQHVSLPRLSEQTTATADSQQLQCAAPKTVNRNFTYAFGNFTATLTDEARKRSYRNINKSSRIRKFLCKLFSGEPVRVVVFGGSVSNGNGLGDQVQQRYSKMLERWLQREFPVKPKPGAKNHEHRVLNKAIGASDSCFLARTLRARMSDQGDLMRGSDNEGTLGSFKETDLVILEFAVNDKQASLGMNSLPSDLYSLLQTDMLACSEAVVQQLLSAKDSLAILYLEYTSGKLWDAVTAESIHELVADRYGIPLLSYRKAVFPELESGEHISNCLPKGKGRPYSEKASSRSALGCNSRFKYVKVGEDGFGTMQLDGTHPSIVGHKLLADLVAHAFITEAALISQNTPVNMSGIPPATAIPYEQLFSGDHGAKPSKSDHIYKDETPLPFYSFNDRDAIAAFSSKADGGDLLRDPVADVGLPSVHLLGLAQSFRDCMQMCMDWKGAKGKDGKIVPSVCHSVTWASKEASYINLDNGQCYSRTDSVWAPQLHPKVQSGRRTDVKWPMIAGGHEALQKKILELSADNLMMTATAWGNGPFTLSAPDNSHPLIQGPRRAWFGVTWDHAVWEYKQEQQNKWGWISDTETGGKAISFKVDYQQYKTKYMVVSTNSSKATNPTSGKAVAYAWTLGFLASYQGMAKFDCDMSCIIPGSSSPLTAKKTVDSQWAHKISVYTEQELIVASAPGLCDITITPKPQQAGRKGNKVKILSIAVSERHL